MQLTAAYLRERFRQLNAQYFAGSLPQPRLVVSGARTMLGQFSCKRRRKGLLGGYENVDFCIRVSDYYEQTADEIDDTLLHEMIHLLIAARQLRDTSPHGRLFRQEMARLNRMGRHISVSQRMQQHEVAPLHRRSQHLVLALLDRDGQHYLSVVHPSYKKYVERLLALVPAIVSHSWVVSRDARFARFPQVRSLRVHKVSAQEYEEVLRGAG